MSGPKSSNNMLKKHRNRILSNSAWNNHISEGDQCLRSSCYLKKYVSCTEKKRTVMIRCKYKKQHWLRSRAGILGHVICTALLWCLKATINVTYGFINMRILWNLTPLKLFHATFYLWFKLVGNLSILWDLHFSSPELGRALPSSKSMSGNRNTAEWL